MDISYKTVLLKILDLVNYEEDKNAFADEFIGLVQMQAIANLMIGLPHDKQDAIKAELNADTNNPEKVAAVIKANFSEDQLQKAVESAATKGLTDWMKAVESTLSDAQKQKLADLSQEFQQKS